MFKNQHQKQYIYRTTHYNNSKSQKLCFTPDVKFYKKSEQSKSNQKLSLIKSRVLKTSRLSTFWVEKSRKRSSRKIRRVEDMRLDTTRQVALKKV